MNIHRNMDTYIYKSIYYYSAEYNFNCILYWSSTFWAIIRSLSDKVNTSGAAE